MAGLSPFNVINFLSLNSANSVKTFRKNSIASIPVHCLWCWLGDTDAGYWGLFNLPKALSISSGGSTQ